MFSGRDDGDHASRQLRRRQMHSDRVARFHQRSGDCTTFRLAHALPHTDNGTPSEVNTSLDVSTCPKLMLLCMGIDYFCSTRHSGRTLTVGQGNYLSRYLRYALKQKARSFVVI